MATFYKTKNNHVLVKIGDNIYFDLTVDDILTEKPEIIGEYTDSNCTTPVHKGPLLSDPAKVYLINIIKPFRDKVKYITFDNDFIEIVLTNGDYMDFPDYDNFPKNFIITSRDDKHHYTLEELGL